MEFAAGCVKVYLRLVSATAVLRDSPSALPLWYSTWYPAGRPPSHVSPCIVGLITNAWPGSPWSSCLPENSTQRSVAGAVGTKASIAGCPGVPEFFPEFSQRFVVSRTRCLLLHILCLGLGAVCPGLSWGTCTCPRMLPDVGSVVPIPWCTVASCAVA